MSNEASTLKPYKSKAGGKKEQVSEMFDNISPKYDLLNRIMTMRIDIIWRKKAIKLLKSTQPQYILDVATGTGDFAIESLRILQPYKIVGVDISAGMLEIAREKIKKEQLEGRFEVQLGDSENLQFADNTFDAVTVAFGVRNFENLEQGLAEIRRVLKPGGKAIILELSNPKTFPIKQLFHLYFHRIVPFIGRFISKDSSAYSYLPESVSKFPDGQRFASVTEKVGFETTRVMPQTFGFCTIYEATK
ncbi:bifunctional demethylmenaquinone methyltransferase/2-methoxy-6-polyprenyl-1,4-benzoquinol methylase UbiE [Parapedobacter sp. SGR-10]|uniref:bifunctional demethylmenaquinone methyltransferase/2-methoxy-6-polyprenyl-1,4-benzoquinol methylase UbiE n=1 Tax=Parapedobacter sp. SGR-10 TaxID=2710879 RepID=UPI0013D4DA96|nr:bifunctional demethylmenaquinone methyltransferase/2-methoxy-6-polyprenyl-1,4-benzoquinol methylase UbiE [Parapedobacter sp. SGR-10]NGF57461.1 bifunctional demethylmenaquinone methyltransferase/2-methoxy-6-polyprenyl-1,4-benzoquinol methylase UbiE [Parapedobacter sp. SGR-10]